MWSVPPVLRQCCAGFSFCAADGYVFLQFHVEVSGLRDKAKNSQKRVSDFFGGR
jgi:hypothetical protein